MTAKNYLSVQLAGPLAISKLWTVTIAALMIGFAVDANAQAKAAPKAEQKLGAGSEPGAKKFEELNVKDFDKSENIDNVWWPLKPGMQWTFDGMSKKRAKRSHIGSCSQ